MSLEAPQVLFQMNENSYQFSGTYIQQNKRNCLFLQNYLNEAFSLFAYLSEGKKSFVNIYFFENHPNLHTKSTLFRVSVKIVFSSINPKLQ